MNNDEEYTYKKICDKLGFDPMKYKAPNTDTEDDRFPNPFLVLTNEEIMFLYKKYMHND